MDLHQFYRLVTSEFTHGNLGHIVMNMLCFLMFGRTMEKLYGTAYYACINIFLGLVSNLISLALNYFMAYSLPKTAAVHQRHTLKQLARLQDNCGNMRSMKALVKSLSPVSAVSAPYFTDLVLRKPRKMHACY